MAGFAGFVVATLVSWILNDALVPYGAKPLRLMGCIMVFMLCFYFVRRTLADIRPDL